MTVFIYDKTFEGLLTAVFDAYVRKSFPDALAMEGEPLPLFCEETVTIYSDSEKSRQGLERSSEEVITYFAFDADCYLAVGVARSRYTYVSLYP